MWTSVPGFGWYIFNSFFISTCATLIVLALVIPAAYAFSRFDFPGAGLVLGGVPRGQHVLGRGADHPALPAAALVRAAQHLLRR